MPLYCVVTINNKLQRALAQLDDLHQGEFPDMENVNGERIKGKILSNLLPITLIEELERCTNTDNYGPFLDLFFEEVETPVLIWNKETRNQLCDFATNKIGRVSSSPLSL
jgi:hypothetical protein